MNTTTITLTISHEGDLPNGLLAAIEAKAYDFTMARGVACGEVVAKVDDEPTSVLTPAIVGQALGIKGSEVMRELMRCGVSVTMNESLDDTCILLLLKWQSEKSSILRLPVKEMRDE